MHILISEIETLPKDLESRLKTAGFTYDIVSSGEEVKQPEIYQAAFGAIIIKKIGLERFTDLKWVQVSSAGTNHLPIAEWKQKGLIITNARGVFSEPIAEWVILYTLMFYKDVTRHLKQQDSKQWLRLENRELTNQTVTILGTGSLGQAIAERFKPFKVRILGVNTSGNQNPHFDRIYPNRELKQVLPISDVVVITLPLTETTRDSFDRSCVEAMKPGSILLNVGRGRIVDEEALIQALNQGKIGGAVLDVMAIEPVPEDSPLWTTKNLLLTPHDSGTGNLTSERLWNLFLRNCGAFISDQAWENRL
jgi:phosphoglycerate dehydrogenase-like enzyme